MKIQKTKKLVTTLVIFSTAILLVLNILVAIIMSVVTGSGMNRKQNALLEQIAGSAQTQIEQVIEQFLSIADVFSFNHQLQSVINNSTQDFPLGSKQEFNDITTSMRELIQKYPNILRVAVGSISEDIIYDQNGEKYDTKLSERPYFSVVYSNTQMLTDPYKDVITGDICVSIATPIIYNSNCVGILVLDIKMDQFSTYLKERGFGQTGKLVLLSNNNTVVGGESEDQLGKNISELEITGDAFIKEMNTPTGSIESYNISGISKLGISLPATDFNWKIIASMEKSEYSKDTNSMVISLLVMLLITTAIVVITLRYLIRRKLNPISEINESLKQMSEGNLKINVAYKSDDEIGEMADSLRSCVETLSSYVQAIDMGMRELAKGNLVISSPIKFKGDFEPIEKSIDAFIEKLRVLLKNIHTASSQVSSGAEQVSNGSQVLSQGATQQASSVQQLAATISDISHTVNSNTKMVVEAQQGAIKVNNDIAESGRKMKQSLQVMGEIKSSSNEISKIIKTIEDIAFQTNILALNAAVEAARAGSAGKGFAVVADEVRNLAGKSAEASQTTTALIETSLSAVEKGILTMEETAKFMESVVQQAQEITGVFNAVASASEEQANSISQVTLGIDQISAVVQTNSATAEESAAASEELSSQAHLLNTLIGQFKIPGVNNNEINSQINTQDANDINNDFDDTYGNYSDYSNDKY